MRSFVFYILLALTLISCSSGQEKEKISEEDTGPTKLDIIAKWKGKSAKDLVKKYGSPDLIIDTTLVGRPASEGYVYDAQRLAGLPGCLNVYVVITFDKRINDYFCR